MRSFRRIAENSGTARAIPELSPRPMVQPLFESMLDFRIRGQRIGSSQILPHQAEPNLEEIECRSQGVPA